MIESRTRRSVGVAEQFSSWRVGFRCHPSSEGVAAVLESTFWNSLTFFLSVASLLFSSCPFFSLFLLFTGLRFSWRCGLSFRSMRQWRGPPPPSPAARVQVHLWFFCFCFFSSPQALSVKKDPGNIKPWFRTCELGVRYQPSRGGVPQGLGAHVTGVAVPQLSQRHEQGHGLEAPGFSALSNCSSS